MSFFKAGTTNSYWLCFHITSFNEHTISGGNDEIVGYEIQECSKTSHQYGHIIISNTSKMLKQKVILVVKNEKMVPDKETLKSLHIM